MTRSARLVPATGQGLSILAVRHQQIWVDGVGTLLRGDDDPEVLAQPGELTRAVLAWDPAYPVLGLFDEHGPRFRVPLWRYHDGSGIGVPEDLLSAAGAGALVEALGLRVARGGPEAASQLSRVAPLEPTVPSSPGRHGARVVAALLLVIFPGLVAVALDVPFAVPLVVLVAALLAWRPVRCLRHDRRRFVAVVTSLPDLPDADRLRPSHPVARRQRTLARMLVSDRWIVVHHHGTEAWVPGPGAGGVTQVLRTRDHLLLRDRADRVLLALHPGWSTDAAAFDAVMHGHGIRVEDRHVRVPDVGLGEPEQWPPGEGVGRKGAFDFAAQGNLSVTTVSVLPALLPFLVCLGLLGGLAHPVQVLAAVPGLLLTALWLQSASWLRRWQRGDPPRHLSTLPPDSEDDDEHRR